MALPASRFMRGLSSQFKAASGRFRRYPMLRSMFSGRVSTDTDMPVSDMVGTQPSNVLGGEGEVTDYTGDLVSAGRPESLSGFARDLAGNVIGGAGVPAGVAAVSGVPAKAILSAAPELALSTALSPVLFGKSFGDYATDIHSGYTVDEAMKESELSEAGKISAKQAAEADRPKSLFGLAKASLGYGKFAGASAEDAIATQKAMEKLNLTNPAIEDLVTAPSGEGAQDYSDTIGRGVLASGESADVDVMSGASIEGGSPGMAGGDSSGLCIIITVCTDADSGMIDIARKFRDKHLDDMTLGGYYAIAKIVVPFLKRSELFRKITKRFLVNRLIDYAVVHLLVHPEWDYGYRTSKYVTKCFLGLCSLIGRFVNCPKLIAQHR